MTKALLTVDPDSALAASLARDAHALRARAGQDKGFGYLVAQHHEIHGRLRSLAERRGDPAQLAVLLRQRAQVLDHLAAHLSKAA